MNNNRPLISTLIVILTGILIVFGGAFSALAADGEVVNLKSTTHTLGTIDAKSQATVISMAWEKAEKANCTLDGYNFKFSTSATDTVLETKNYPATTTGTDSDSFTGKDGVAYYFHVKAVFIDSANEDSWGPLVSKGPYYIDDTAPLNPSVSINDGATSTDSINVTLTLGATSVAKMNISNTSYGAGTSWEDYAASKAWTLTTGDGSKTVYVQFKDTAGNISQKNANINLAVEALSVSSDSTTVTKGVTLTFTGSGGTPDYTWSVVEEKNEDGINATAGNIATIAVDPSDNTKGILTPVGAGTCKVKVTDSAGTPLEATSSVITVTVLSISPNTAAVANGQTQQFATESGTAPFTWSLTITNSAGTINSSTGLFTAHASNEGEGTITVTDANSVEATATVSVTSASIAVNTGGSQTVNVAVPVALSVIVKEGDTGTANYVIDFTVTADPNTGAYVKGSFSDTAPADSGSETLTCQALTNGDGIASTPFFVGQKAGTYTISAACTKKDNDGTLGGDTNDVSVTNSPRPFTIIGVAGDADKIEYFSGNDQTGTPGSPLTNPFVVLVTDEYANPKLGTTVTFAVAEGTGTLSAATDPTDSDGKASTILTTSAGTNTVTATVDDLTGSPVTFTAEGGLSKIFSLITTATTNTNTVGFVLEGTGITTAHELGTAVGNCDLVSKWVVDTQSYLSHPMSVETYNNFTLEVGNVYFVSVTADHDFTLTGNLPGSLVKNLSTTATTNTNAIGLPYSKSGLLNAHQLGQDIGNCDLVSKWVVDTQSYLSHPMSVETYNNFAIEWGEGYFISVTGDTNWAW